MATYTSKGMGFAIDDSVGTLVSISAYTNDIDLSNNIEQLDDTGLGDSLRSYIDGLGDAPTVTVNGSLNSTTEPIFTRLAVIQTSVSNVKTIEVQLAATIFYGGEATIENVQVSGSVGARGSWSATCRPTSGLTETSVTAVA